MTRLSICHHRLPLAMVAAVLMVAHWVVTPVHAQTKRALIIAIGEYPRPELTGYKSLHSANDIPLVRGALERHGFRGPDIAVVSNAEATKEGILTGLERLRDQSGPGDYVVIHYSGHGNRITDDSGDESDGYDEVLVPYGASARMPEGYDGSGHIRDDQLGALIGEIGSRVREDGAMGQLLVTVDACFSGSITRSTLPVRGSPDPIGPPAFPQALDRKQDELREALTDGAAPLPPSTVLITATRFGELDHEVRGPEGQGVGPLSLAFANAMSDLEPGTSYQLLFERIRSEMARIARFQQPTMEGEAGLAVFGGDVSDPVVYHRVVRVDEETVVLDGGTVAGIGAGSRVQFVVPEASAYREIATGVVTSSSPLEARVEVDGTSGADVRSALVFITERAAEGGSQGVLLTSTSPGFASSFDRMLASSDGGSNAEQVESEEDADVVLERLPSGFVGLYVLPRLADAKHIREFEDSSDGGAQAARYVKALGLARFLGSVDLTTPDLAVDFEFKPGKLRIVEQWPEVLCEASEADLSDHSATPGGTSSWALDPNQGYVLQVANDGERAAYFNVLFLAEDGSVEPLYPAAGATDNYLPAGSSFLIPQCFMAAGEAGSTAMLKLFATSSPLNLADLLAGIEDGTVRQRASAGGFESALRQAAGMTMRSGGGADGLTRTILLVGRD